MSKIFAFSSSIVTLKFSVHDVFETRVLLKIFDAEFPYKLSYFEPLCLPAKMAAETVIRSINVQGSARRLQSSDPQGKMTKALRKTF